jgi:glyoxylase-like metal-dependent hydrolase (beta-lactamase superfamily II)
MTTSAPSALPDPTVPPGGSWTVGSVRVTPLYDGTLLTPPEHLYALACSHFPALPGSLGLARDDWRRHDQALTAGLLELTFGGYLVEPGDGRVVLVDAGQGPTDWAPHPSVAPQVYGRLLDSMRAAGVEPDDVTDVVITHLHADHLGWAATDGRPTFGNATYRCHADDLSLFVPANDVADRALSPALDRLQVWHSADVVAGPVSVRPAPGHTPGTTIVTVESGGEQLWLLGDVFHSVPELVDTIRWCGLADIDALGALRTRLAVAEHLEHHEVPFAAAHFPGMPRQRLVRRDGRLALVDADASRHG